MIDHFDNLLRHLFIATIDEIDDEKQVGFEPPDEQWCSYVSNLNLMTLNLYLLDIKENCNLRSNEKIREIQNGMVIESLAPERIDCHYLITAWSPASLSNLVEPTVDEHSLLYKVVGALMNSKGMTPRKIYDPELLPSTFPAILADIELPLSVLPAEGFPKFAEFWGTMEWRWKPALYLIATLPVVIDKQIEGPMVTTRITEYRQSGKPETAEVWVQIGGRVLDSEKNGIPDAIVDIQDVKLRSKTNEKGQYIFSKVPIGEHTVRVVAVGFQPKIKTIVVPGQSEEYEITLDSL